MLLNNNQKKILKDNMESWHSLSTLIHIHVYYTHLWPELRACVERAEALGLRFRLFVTTAGEKPEIAAEVAERWPEAEVSVVPNRGYDIAPFLEVLSSVRLADFSYIIKLHTKRDVEQARVILCTAAAVNMKGSRWRDALLAFTRPENFEKVLQTLESKPQLGMVAHHLVICPRVSVKDKEQSKTWQKAVEMVKTLGLPEPPNSHFVMGSMFICRAELLKPLQRLGLTTEDFPPPDPEHLEETIAHVIERLLGAVVTAQGYEIRDCFSPRKEYIREAIEVLLQRIGHFLFSRKVTSSGKLIIKICKIPVWHGRGRANARD